MSAVNIYIYGCATCGTNARYIKMVQSYYAKKDISVVVKKAKHSMPEYLFYLGSVLEGIISEYHPIIVDEKGNVTKLREWNK